MKKKFFGVVMSLCLAVFGGVLLAACDKNTEQYDVNVSFGNKMIYTETQLAKTVTHGTGVSFDVYGPVYYDYSDFNAYLNGKLLKSEFKKEEYPTDGIDIQADYVLIGKVDLKNIQQDCLISFGGEKEFQFTYQFYSPDKNIITASDRTELTEKQLDAASKFSLRLSSDDSMQFDKDEMSLAELVDATYNDEDKEDLILPEKYVFSYSASELYDVHKVDGEALPQIKYKGLSILANKSYGYYADDGNMKTFQLFKWLKDASYGQLSMADEIFVNFEMPEEITKESKRTFILDHTTKNGDGELSTFVKLKNNILVFPSETIETTKITMVNNDNVKLWNFVSGLKSLANLHDVTDEDQTNFEVFLDLAEGVNIDNIKLFVNGRQLAGDLGRFNYLEEDSKLSVSLATGLTPIDFFTTALLSGEHAAMLEEDMESCKFYLTVEGVELSNLENFTKIKTTNLEVGGKRQLSWTTTGEFNLTATGVVPVDKYKNAYYVDGEYSYYRNADIATGNKFVATFYKPFYGDKLEDKTEHLSYKIGEEEIKYIDIMIATAEGTIVYQTESVGIVKFAIDENMTGYAKFVAGEGATELAYSISEIEYLLVEIEAKPATAKLQLSVEMREPDVVVEEPEE